MAGSLNGPTFIICATEQGEQAASECEQRIFSWIYISVGGNLICETARLHHIYEFSQMQ